VIWSRHIGYGAAGLAALAAAFVVTFAVGRSAPPAAVGSTTPQPAESAPDIDDNTRQLGYAKLVETVKITPTPAPTVVPPIVIAPVDSQREASAAHRHLRPIVRSEPKNICERHKMTKVKVGRYGWRCKKV
jgi:hypothetical protein